MAGLYQVYLRKQTHFQIGDNTNLFDWTYVGNVARAHLLAADKLSSPPITPPTKMESERALPREVTTEEQNLISSHLPSIDLTTGFHRIPTCEARPLGPYVTPPPNAEKISAAFTSLHPEPSNRPVVRSRFDPLSVESLSKQAESPLQVAGQAFFITNGEPVYFWDFPRAVWTLLDAALSNDSKKWGLIKLPKSVGLVAATGAEWFDWLIGREPTFTRYKVNYSCATRWHNIEKARRVLGYEPEVGLGEGIRLTVEVGPILVNVCQHVLIFFSFSGG
jgi:sterol-4alpha-carboxylate 3-dehydrogenase (decarboxylating)